MASIEDAAEYGERADALVSGVLSRMMRQARSVGTAMDYVRALSRDTRANCWELAERAGHEGPHRMQALLRRYKWAWRELRGELAGLAAQCLPDDPDDPVGPGLAVDETADLRKGSATACVAPQHAGVTGKVENCVTWVFTALVTASGQAWADFDVYMPKSWAKDSGRRAKAGTPSAGTIPGPHLRRDLPAHRPDRRHPAQDRRRPRRARRRHHPPRRRRCQREYLA